MWLSPNRSWWAAVVASLVLSLGCRGGQSSQVDPSLAFRGNKEAKAEVGGAPDCPGAEVFTNPGIDDPEFPLAEIYRAALMPDNKQAYARFAQQFVSSLDARFLREQQWPRVRKHVRKYIQDPDAFSFQLCRRETKPDGAVKVFVRSFDERKSNPPCTLVEHEGSWKVKFFTY